MKVVVIYQILESLPKGGQKEIENYSKCRVCVILRYVLLRFCYVCVPISASKDPKSGRKAS
jgi:hypothetical protein